MFAKGAGTRAFVCVPLALGLALVACREVYPGFAGESGEPPRRGASDATVADDGAAATFDGTALGADDAAEAGGDQEDDAGPAIESGPMVARPNLDLSANRLETFVVAPHLADPEIPSSTIPQQQYAIWDTRVKAQREKLVVLIPSEAADPAAQRPLGEIVAGYGFQVVLPGYVNGASAVRRCLTGVRCTAAALQREQFEGVDASDAITVAPPHALERRVARMLAYLAIANPAGDWGFYLSGNEPRWERIVVGGFSAGGTMAVFTALNRNVSRVVMLGAPWSPNDSWVTIERSVTSSEAFYGFVHQRADRYVEVMAEWETLGLPSLGPLVLVDGSASPYGQAHRLQSNVAVREALCAHFSAAPGDCSPKAANGTYLFAPVWRYLFTGE
ncbi:MAG TPA: hypothetical protein VFH73_07945 [Polyangia bacterium]|nr:hypothetical protein [Polyangia bacterium]